MAVSQKLSHLLQLADQGPALRAALAEEVAELLTSWPPDFPEHMRAVCEALLAKAARDVDPSTRARLRVLLYADPELAQRVLPRDCSSQALVEKARAGANLAAVLAEGLEVDDKTAGEILRDDSGASLAVACKGAHLDRAVFSALALLAHPAHDRCHAFAMLDSFDRIQVSEAARTLRGWREGQAA
jgi:hypothetical protein